MAMPASSFWYPVDPANSLEKEHADHGEEEKHVEQVHRFDLRNSSYFEDRTLVPANHEPSEQLANATPNSRIDLDVELHTNQQRQKSCFELFHLETPIKPSTCILRLLLPSLHFSSRR
jgi:hypothetical protein